MLFPLRAWAPLGLLLMGVQQSFGNKQQAHSYQDVTVVDTKTVTSPTTVPVTRYTTVDVTKPHYVDVTHYITKYVAVTVTNVETATKSVTESTTTTLHYTVSTTQTYLATVTNTKTDLATITNTKTDLTTITNTKTDLTTITNTKTDSTTITNTQTTTTTTTVLSIEVDPCPKSCSISAGTVNVYFWPTNRPATYPTTYVHPTLGYTFTSPSVYLYVPTAVGTKSGGQRAGPATSSWMIPQRLEEVSTIDGAGSTRQLTLADLRTDCPQSAEPSEIATMVNSACDPILAAPKTVSRWAFPCNACGRFGLFDPPYAVPTLPGGLVPTTAPPPPPPPPVTVTAQPVPTSNPPPPPPVSVTAQPVPTSSPLPPPPPPPPVTSGTPTTPTLTPLPSTVVTAAAAKVVSGLAWTIPGILTAIFLAC